MERRARMQTNRMKEAKRILKALAYSAAIGLASATGSAKATGYEIIKLAPPDPNCNFSEAYSINNDGEIIGIYGEAYRDIVWQKCFLYKEGDFRELNLDCIDGYSVINDWGEILSCNKIYRPNNIIDIGFWGKDMNNKGEVAGNGVLYRNGEFIEISGVYRTKAINDKGQVVGYLIEDIYPYRQYGFLWEEEFTMRLDDFWHANDINNNETVVGTYFKDGHLEPCLWNSETGTTFLTGSGAALAINDLDQMVGTKANRAFIYQNEETTYLDGLIPEDSGWTRLYGASDINNKGQIIGNGHYEENGESYGYAFLLNPISKPKTLKADLNDDGIVNGKDLAELANQWLEREDWYEE